MGLKGIPQILSPDLLHALASMGHGDEIVLADTHFPTSSICKEGPKEIRADGHKISDLLKAILQVFPLDSYSFAPIKLMEVVAADKFTVQTPIWNTYKSILKDSVGKEVAVLEVERFEFYEQAKQAYAIVHTGETAKYGNIILKKGVLET